MESGEAARNIVHESTRGSEGNPGFEILKSVQQGPGTGKLPRRLQFVLGDRRTDA